MRMERSNNEFLLGATLGCFVGAATALLLTPVSGKNLRKNILQEMKKRQHEMNGIFIHAPARARTSTRTRARKQHRKARAAKSTAKHAVAKA
jgi:gas vesicle protein